MYEITTHIYTGYSPSPHFSHFETGHYFAEAIFRILSPPALLSLTLVLWRVAFGL